jgi:alpha-galactosidase
MPQSKIVAIGAGSDVFGLNMVSTLLRDEALRGCTLTLVDRDEPSLAAMTSLAERVNREWATGWKIESNMDTLSALNGADFVICSIAASPREGLWKMDYEIPLKFGVRQPYAENSGPGGFAQAARNIPMVMQIVAWMEKVCPKALFINFTNPMLRICDAVNRYSTIQVVGMCHQIAAGYAMVGKALHRELGLEIPRAFTGTHSSPAINPARAQVSRATRQKVSIQAAGTNHFTWMLRLEDSHTHEDLLPMFTLRWQELDPAFEPLTRRVFDIFGIFPIPGDEHLCEYLPWMSDPVTKPWEKYDLSLYEWDLRAALREQGHAQIRRLADGEGTLDDLLKEESEGAAEVISAAVSGKQRHWDAVNVPNRGYIPNLPENAIVEVPVTLGKKLHPAAADGLPKGVAELCRREITTAQIGVDAAVKGDRKLALQCLLLDPVVRDLDAGEKILDAYLKEYRDYLPQFWK